MSALPFPDMLGFYIQGFVFLKKKLSCDIFNFCFGQLSLTENIFKALMLALSKMLLKNMDAQRRGGSSSPKSSP